MNAVLIVYFAISSRIGFISIGSSTPGRMTLILTDVPRGPFNFETTSFRSMPLVDSPLTWLMTSPTRKPTFSAGDPTNGGETTVTFPKRVVTVMPKAVVLAALIFTQAN